MFRQRLGQLVQLAPYRAVDDGVTSANDGAADQISIHCRADLYLPLETPRERGAQPFDLRVGQRHRRSDLYVQRHRSLGLQRFELLAYLAQKRQPLVRRKDLYESTYGFRHLAEFFPHQFKECMRLLCGGDGRGDKGARTRFRQRPRQEVKRPRPAVLIAALAGEVEGRIRVGTRECRKLRHQPAPITRRLFTTLKAPPRGDPGVRYGGAGRCWRTVSFPLPAPRAWRPAPATPP